LNSHAIIINRSLHDSKAVRAFALSKKQGIIWTHVRWLVISRQMCLTRTSTWAFRGLKHSLIHDASLMCKIDHEIRQRQLTIQDVLLDRDIPTAPFES
jgi:hypothetical protein